MQCCGFFRQMVVAPMFFVFFWFFVGLCGDWVQHSDAVLPCIGRQAQHVTHFLMIFESFIDSIQVRRFHASVDKRNCCRQMTYSFSCKNTFVLLERSWFRHIVKNRVWIHEFVQSHCVVHIIRLCLVQTNSFWPSVWGTQLDGDFLGSPRRVYLQLTRLPSLVSAVGKLELWGALLLEAKNDFAICEAFVWNQHTNIFCGTEQIVVCDLTSFLVYIIFGGVKALFGGTSLFKLHVCMCTGQKATVVFWCCIGTA